MNIYQEASRLKLRFSTTQGLLSVEQLWDLSLAKLATAIKEAKNKIQKDNPDDELSFLDENKNVDIEAQLTFDVLKDVYVTKKQEMDAAKTTADNKAHNEKILGLIYDKEQKEMGEKSIEELKAMLK